MVPMLRSLHIGRYITKQEDFRKLADFFEAIGFDAVAGDAGSGRSALLSAPRGLLSINALSPDYPPEILTHLKDVARLIVLEVSNPDAVFQMAEKQKFEVLADKASPSSGERSFTLKLPGEIIVTVHGKPGDAPAAVKGELKGEGKRFAIVVSRFNSFITERLLEGALDGLSRMGVQGADIVVMRVPGAFEIPSAARTLAETKKYDAILCIGCLLRGDTAHYDVIANEVTRGIGQSAQETGIPHAFGVLTCDTLEQAIDRAGLKAGNKGFEAAMAAVEMASLKKAVKRAGKKAAKKAVSSQPSTVSRKSRAKTRRSDRRQSRPKQGISRG
jgi:6,7-dimethyl-8-ribityllumazine synthase